MKTFLFLFQLLAFTLTAPAAFAQNAQAVKSPKAFVHPGLLQSRQDLAFMKQKVMSGEQPWKGAFEKLRSSASLDFKPEPFTHVVRGSYGRSAVGGSELSASANAAYTHALLWSITGEKAYALKAIKILNAWSPVLWDFDDNDAKLLAAWTGHTFCNAAEILRYSDSGWEQKDIEQFKRLMLTVYYPLIQGFFSEANGNWDGAMINTMLCIGIFCDDREIFDRALNHYLRGPGNGGITKYIYPSGQCQESTRDMPHVQLGLGELAEACQVAWTQGVDLYGVADNRLALGYEYTAKYMLGEEVPVYGTISPKGRGNFRDIYEPLLQHYRQVKGMELPYTAQAAEKVGPESSRVRLTAYRAPLKQAPKPLAGPPQPSAVAAQAGAIAGPTAPPPAGAILVAPGESIQAALDASRPGGWVVLAKGLHTLPAALRMPSGVTLAGQGRETILFLDPKAPDRTAIVNGAADLHDVTLRDFVVEGATTSTTSSDPNQDRRHRASQLAPRRAGIDFSALREGQMRHLRLEHVTVRNCTLNGVAIKGATQIAVTNCDFSDNGGSVVPGRGLQHNLLITRTIEIQVTGSRLDTSPWGSGLDLTHSRDAEITANEAARNALHGIRVSESQNVRMDGNLTEGNDGSGLLMDKMMDGSQRIEVRDNVSRLNGEYGIGIHPSVGSTVRGNDQIGNGKNAKKNQRRFRE